MKESSTRGIKRRRDAEPGSAGAEPNTAVTGNSNNNNAPVTPDRTTSLSASPVAQHTAVPASSGTTSSTSTNPNSGIPAPVTAANTGAAGSFMWSTSNRFYTRERPNPVAAKQT